MSEKFDEYAKTLEVQTTSMKDVVISKLKKLYIRYPLTDVAHYDCWKRFLETATTNPKEVKFYISRLLAIENKLTLKIGLDTNEETGENGFILPLTLQQALALHVSFNPDTYRELCKQATSTHIGLLQKTINSLTRDKTLQELEGVDKAFAKSLIRDLQPLIDLLNELEKDDLERNWLEIIQLYFVQ